MTYTDEYLKRLYGDGGLTRLLLDQLRKVTDEIAEAEAKAPELGKIVTTPHDEKACSMCTVLPKDWVAVHYESPFMHPIAPAMLIEPTGDVTLTGFELRTMTPVFGSTVSVSTKCADCGLDGNHDTWCPHWQPYVADEA